MTTIVGIDARPYYSHGASWPQTITELCGKTTLAASEDTGTCVRDIDGFADYAGTGAGYGVSMRTASIMEALGIPRCDLYGNLDRWRQRFGWHDRPSLGRDPGQRCATYIVTIIAL